jgi:hypothetical protein
MKLSLASVAAAGLLALAACGSHAPTPTPYANSAWGFGATFPGKPTVTETQASATQAHSLLVEANVGGEDFAVNVLDATGAEGDPSDIMDRAQKVLADAQDLDVGASTPVTIGDLTAREVRFDKDGKPVMLTRLLMINGRLYEINANSQKGPSDPAVKAFLNSFHLVASPDTGASAAAAAASAPAANAPASNAAH